jgi:hypothetical protein
MFLYSIDVIASSICVQLSVERFTNNISICCHDRFNASFRKYPKMQRPFGDEEVSAHADSNKFLVFWIESYIQRNTVLRCFRYEEYIIKKMLCDREK